MQKKKIIGIIIALFIIGISIFLLAVKPDTQIKEVITKSVKSEQAVNHVTEQKEQDPEKEQEDTEPKKDVTEQLKSFIVNAVDNTVDFFTNKEISIVAIGDSLTQGVGDTTGNGGYVGILDKTINHNKQLVEFKNYGKRGNRSDQLLKRLDEPEIAASIKEANVVLITIGANDIMKVVKQNFANLTYKDFIQERSAYEERLSQIFDKVNKLNPNTEIYLLGFYNPFEKYFTKIKELGMIVNDWNTTGKNVASRYENVTFIPTIDLFNGADVDLFAADNFHPNTRGYQRMAKRVLKYLME